ncbi:hypothetical protein ACUOCP_26660, partial [Escherichia sp. R-CC3]
RATDDRHHFTFADAETDIVQHIGLHTAFLVVTHDLQLAKRMSRQLEMRDGRLTAELSLMGAE